MHETSFRIRATMLDTYGHLNHARYFDIFEWARWEWIEDTQVSGEELTSGRGVGPAIINAEIDYLREVRHHERVQVRTWCHQVQGIKGTIRQEMVREDGAIAARVQILFVMFNLERRRAVPITPEMRALCDADADYSQGRAAEPFFRREQLKR